MEKADIDLNETPVLAKGHHLVDDEPVELTKAEHRKLRLKLDLRLMPILWMIYFTNYLDRAAVGSSVAHGFRADVGLTGNDYNIGISLFFLFYALTEVPNGLCNKKFGAKIWLPTMTLCFATVSLATAFIHTPAQFYIVRILLAIFETAVSPGITYFLSIYYDRHQMAFRVPLFLSGAALGSAIQPFIANGLVSLGRISPQVYGWRNLFVVDAIITYGVAILGFIILPHPPARAKFLNERERKFILARTGRLTAGVQAEEGTNWTLVKRGLTSPITWFAWIVLFLGNLYSASITYFLPIVGAGQFGWRGNTANVHTGAVFFAGLGGMLLAGYLADRTRVHSPYVISILILSLIGMLMFFYSHDRSARYAGFFLGIQAALGGISVGTSQAAGNLAPYTVKNVGLSLFISFGAFGGILGSWIFLPREASRAYPTARTTILTLVAIGIVTQIGFAIYLIWENKQRDLGKRDHRLEGKTQIEIEELGNLHPSFRYVL